jgi:hypothetical protein
VQARDGGTQKVDPYVKFIDLLTFWVSRPLILKENTQKVDPEDLPRRSFSNLLT